MTRDELVARDEALLEEVRQAAEAVIGGMIPGYFDPAWGPTYDPYRILAGTADPGVFRLTLVTIRKALRPEESWSQCAHCARLYQVESYGNMCSPECFAARSNFLDNPQ